MADEFPRQRQVVRVDLVGDLRDVEHYMVILRSAAERSGDDTQRMGNQFKIYPRDNPMASKLYDVKCHELAEHFLSDNASTSKSLADEARKCESLARAIQEAVEDWFSMEEPDVIFRSVGRE